MNQPYSITFYSASQVAVYVLWGGCILAIQVVLLEVFTFLSLQGFFSEIRELDQIFLLSVLPGVMTWASLGRLLKRQNITPHLNAMFLRSLRASLHI